MSKAMEINSEEFEKEVLQSSKPVLVDFWAEWCPPCKMLAPVLEEIAEERKGQLKIVKVNVDTNPSLATQFGIMSIPTLILFKNGQPTEKLIGYMPKARLLKVLDKHLLDTGR